MPKLLDTPLVFPVAHGVSGGTHTHIKVTRFDWDGDAGTVTLCIRYGNYDAASSTWTPATEVAGNCIIIENIQEKNQGEIPANPEYNNFVGGNLQLYDDLAEAVYAHLETVRGLYAGTVE